ncbi:MAG: pilus assembly protein PilM [candidate division Zixibacteria bacterium]|nr:pilus assembly protein PilM [candidate division Zixibacteria bacterium]
MLNLASLIRKKGQPIDSPEADPRLGAASFSEIRLSSSRSINYGRYLAFSIDEKSVQMVTVLQYGRKTRVLDARNVPIPEDISSEEAKRDYLSGSLAEYVDRYGGWHPKVSLTVSGRDTIFRTFKMPMLKTGDLNSAIYYEAGRQLPFPVSESSFDYRCISKTTDRDKTQYRIALCASTEKYINEQLEPFHQNGIGVLKIFHTHDVIGTLLTYLPDFDEENNYTLMEVTRDYCTVSFFRGSTLVFLHHGSTGISHLGDHPDDTQLKFLAKSLAKEVNTAQDYYSGRYAGNSPDRILLFGDTAHSLNLPALLDGYTNYQFELFPIHWLEFLQNQEYSFNDTLFSCLPALAASVCRNRQFNLLPRKQKEKLARRKLFYVATASLCLLAFILIGSWALMHQKAGKSQRELNQLAEQIALITQSESYHTYMVLKQEMAVARSYLEKVKPAPSYLSLNLKELSRLTPASVRLNRLDYNPIESPYNLMLHGQATASRVPSEVILAEYVENLRASQFYDDVSITRHTKKKVGGKFIIEFQIRMRAVV